MSYNILKRDSIHKEDRTAALRFYYLLFVLFSLYGSLNLFSYHGIWKATFIEIIVL